MRAQLFKMLDTPDRRDAGRHRYPKRAARLSGRTWDAIGLTAFIPASDYGRGGQAWRWPRRGASSRHDDLHRWHGPSALRPSAILGTLRRGRRRRISAAL